MSADWRRQIGSSIAAVALAAMVACGDDRAPHEPAPAPGSQPLVRPDTPGNTRLLTYDASETVETFPSVGGHFLVHFTRDGPDAVPLADNDASGVPDYVELFASTYEAARDHYSSMGFQMPVSDQAIADNGGDGKFDVYLLDFAGEGDGNYHDDGCNGEVCAGYTIDENDFVGYGYASAAEAMRILSSHELFHAIQSSYDNGQGTIMGEGTAVWGTETFDPTLPDFESFLPGYLDNTDRPIDEPIGGAADAFSYGSAIFFWFLEERYGDGTILGLWEHCKNGAGGVADPNWFAILDGYLTEKAGVSFAQANVEFATWNLFTASHFDPARGYAAGYGYAPVKMQKVEAPYSDEALRLYHASAQYFHAPAAGRDTMSAALVAKDPADLEGITLLLVDEQGNTYGPVTPADDPSAPPSIAMSGSDALVVVAVNTATTGESKKPGLCIGTPDEIAACKDALLAQGGAGGGSSSSSGGGNGTDDGGGCGCRVSPLESTSAEWIALSVAVGLVVVRRRR